MRNIRTDTKEKRLQDVIDARDEYRNEIFAAARDLRDRAESIKDNGFERPLTKAEIRELGEINSAMGVLLAAENDLVIMTVQSLSQTVEVKRLITVVDAVNQDLKNKLQKITGIAKKITRVANLIKRAEVVLQSLSRLATVLAGV